MASWAHMGSRRGAVRQPTNSDTRGPRSCSRRSQAGGLALLVVNAQMLSTLGKAMLRTNAWTRTLLEQQGCRRTRDRLLYQASLRCTCMQLAMQGTRGSRVATCREILLFTHFAGATLASSTFCVRARSKVVNVAVQVCERRVCSMVERCSCSLQSSRACAQSLRPPRSLRSRNAPSPAGPRSRRLRAPRAAAVDTAPRVGTGVRGAADSHETDVVVIGAGVGGLSCGGMLAKYGLDVTVLESHTVCGGAAHVRSPLLCAHAWSNVPHQLPLAPCRRGPQPQSSVGEWSRRPAPAARLANPHANGAPRIAACISRASLGAGARLRAKPTLHCSHE